jgi:hypothetical protein
LLSPFLSLTAANNNNNNNNNNNAFRHSLSFHRKYIHFTGYIGGQKSISSGVPVYTSAGVFPLAMQAPLVTLIELFSNYKPSAGRGKTGTWVARQTGKSK